MSHDVFISYSKREKAIADEACASMEREGIRCWIAPRNIPHGKPYTESLVKAIYKSRVFVLVFSEGANRSQHVLREVERAVCKSIPILPFRIEEVVPTPSMEYLLSAPQWLDAATPPVENHYPTLAESVKQLLNEDNSDNETREAVPPRRAASMDPAKSDSLGDIVQSRPAFNGRIWTEREPQPMTRDIQSVGRCNKAVHLIGAEFSVNALSDRDCYLTIYNLGTSGNMFVLLKNHRLQAGVPAVLSGPDERLAWRVAGPPGIERMKALFSLQPLNVFPGADGFTLLSQSGNPIDMVEKIRTLVMHLDHLDPKSWTEAECEFLIQNP